MPFTDQVMALLSRLGTLRPDLRWHLLNIASNVSKEKQRSLPRLSLTVYALA